MEQGLGRYDALCADVMRATQAHVAVVIVLDGNAGSGFSVQALGDDNAHEVAVRLPEILELIAMQIRRRPLRLETER